MASLDNLILIGFKDPHDTDSFRMLMDIANVPVNNIFFIEDEKPIPDIIRENFIPDKSQKYNFILGNTLCIVSDSVDPTYRKKVERLRKMEIPVKSGYQNVDLSELNELEMTDWFNNGHYNPIKQDSEQEESSLIDDLLGVDNDSVPYSEVSVQDENSNIKNDNDPIKEENNNIDSNKESLQKEMISDSEEDNNNQVEEVEESEPEDLFDFDELLSLIHI